MDSRIGIGLGILVIGLLVWNSWTVNQMEQRIQELEEQNSNPAKTQNDSPLQAHDRDVGSSSTPTLQRSSSGSTQQAGARSYMDSTGQPTSSAKVSELIEALDHPEYQEALVDLMDDYFAEREEDQLDEGEANFLDYINEKVEIFGETNGIDDATMGQMIQEIETKTAQYFEVMRQAKAGDISWLEARPQMQEIREEAETNLIDILGEELYEVYEQEVRGGQPPR